jgi:hypothetical protein
MMTDEQDRAAAGVAPTVERPLSERQFHTLAVAMLGFARNPQQTYENARAVLQQVADSGVFDTSGVAMSGSTQIGAPGKSPIGVKEDGK